MDIVKILKKVNRTNDMLLGAKNGLQNKLIQYTKIRVVENMKVKRRDLTSSENDQIMLNKRKDLYEISIKNWQHSV